MYVYGNHYQTQYIHTNMQGNTLLCLIIAAHICTSAFGSTGRSGTSHGRTRTLPFTRTRQAGVPNVRSWLPPPRTPDSLVILEDCAPELFNFANIRQFEVKLLAYHAAGGMYHIAQGNRNYTFDFSDPDWQLMQIWDQVLMHEDKPDGHGQMDTERYSLHYLMNEKKQQSEWKVIKRIGQQKKDTPCVKTCAMRELPDWLIPWFRIKNPGNLIIRLEHCEGETQKIEDYSHKMCEANKKLEQDIHYFRSENTRLQSEKDRIAECVGTLESKLSAKEYDNKELREQMDTQQRESEARLHQIRRAITAGARKPDTELKLQTEIKQISSIFNASFMIEKELQSKIQKVTKLTKENEELKAAFAQLQRDKTTIIDGLKTSRTKIIIDGLNNTQVQVDELKKRIEERDIRLRAMNNSLFGQTASKLQINLSRQEANLSQSRSDFANGLEGEKEEKSKHDWLWFSVIASGIGVAFIMMLVFGTVYCLRKYRKRKSTQMTQKSKEEEEGNEQGNDMNDTEHL